MAFFHEGVKPGGLTADYEVKILVCYLLTHTDRKLTVDELNDIILGERVVNYFELSQAISSLEASGHISILKEKGKPDCYELTDLGKKAAVTFEKDIPRSVRENTLRAANDYIVRKRFEKENLINIVKVEDGYILEIRITDVGSDLLKMDVFAPTYDECVQMKERLLASPNDIYRHIISMLTEENS
jgi:DNA-binding PadR family transcriptional regulator